MGDVVLTFAQFEVKGTTDTYFVNYDDESGWYCGCPDHYYRKRECTHILLIMMMNLDGIVAVQTIIIGKGNASILKKQRGL